MTTPPTIPRDDSDRGRPAVEPEAGPRVGARLRRRAYVLFLVRGAVALALGITLLTTGANLDRLTTFVAVYWIVAALLTLHWVGAHRTQAHSRLGFLAGTIGLVAGTAVVLRPLLDAVLSRGGLLDLLGASAIATGVLRLSGALHDDQLAREHPRPRYRFVMGGVELLLGLTLLTANEGASEGIRVAVAVWGLVTGTFLLLDALMLHRLTRSPPGRPT